MAAETNYMVGNSMTSSRTKCFGYDEFHIQRQVCNAAPTVFCHSCQLAFCQSCEDEFHFGKRPENHKRTYANPNGLVLKPCVFESHQRRQCKELGVANCDICAFSQYACLPCIQTHHLGLRGHTDMIHQVSVNQLFPLPGISSFIPCFIPWFTYVRHLTEKLYDSTCCWDSVIRSGNLSIHLPQRDP